MPIPRPVHDRTRDPGFWELFFWFDHRREEDPALFTHETPFTAEQYAELEFHGPTDQIEPINRFCQLDFPVGDGYGLRLSFDAQMVGFTLYLLRPGGDEFQLGWHDEAHWHPHVLRWEELDVVCRCQALADPALPHPGLPLLLLHRFAPLTEGDTPDAAMALLRSAWRVAGVSGDAARRYVERVDCRGNGFEWRQPHPGGWVLHQDDRLGYRRGLYTVRWFGNPEFPHATLNRMVAAARTACDVAVRPGWRTAAVTGLAAAVAGGAFDSLPVLADALEEAGCDHPAVLAHLRDPDPARGAWVAELVLDAEWGSVVRKLPARSASDG